MNYLSKSNGKDNYLKSHLCPSCKNVDMSLRSLWHNTVDVVVTSEQQNSRTDNSLEMIETDNLLSSQLALHSLRF